ncbi:L-rhamnose mutarotase [Chitinophaga sp. XS-30]|uniref:L-rhamnose mutarotase n=1 Tax=Chitinophaga sp. XS-30 TaxID=2604421 RepID=UPI0011DD9F0B|nr:L-rhamnose mutarotase [Chitinophaga sp. XS-30]QEH40774.1 L-rhamnose mutarotase [Chitinophaga sp. XS-30]
MQRVGFKMKLKKGFEAEYKKRHDELWPELEALLKSAGIRDYVIFLDEETLSLFASLSIDDPAALDELPKQPVMQRWWEYMSGLMDCHPDNSPVTFPLKEVFYMQ